mgnify:CR=1 FL=1
MFKENRYAADAHGREQPGMTPQRPHQTAYTEQLTSVELKQYEQNKTAVAGSAECRSPVKYCRKTDRRACTTGLCFHNNQHSFPHVTEMLRAG